MTASETAAPTPEPTSTAAPSASVPTPTPTTDPADPSTWLISEAGIGPITLNAPFSDAVAQLPTDVERDPEVCTHSVLWQDADGDNLWIVRDASRDDAAPLELVEWGDWTEPYDVGGPRTAAGIGVGSTVDEVWAAYPDALETTQRISPDIHYISVDAIFFSYREPSTVINVVTVTDAEQPPYEICG
ncbi:hypothetical protein [Microbacterium sp. zg.B185]|uniref:hypothetical protein n=1 Tax=Microbacterium sp. zg.B185 TaxID=2969410 RepID=UPI00214BF5BC|nr:hypothetical protein [Microbacterium sp. zg.B185]